MKEDIKYLHELGIGTIRINLPWQMVEPRQGDFDWSKTDLMVKAANERHLEILFTLASISSWGTKGTTKRSGIYHSASAPKDINEWKRFAKELAGRYKGRGVHYEIGNEVNGKTFWTGTIGEYLNLLKASYSAIKEADSQAMVLSSAMGCGIVRDFGSRAEQNEMRKKQDEWLRPILSTMAFDVVAVHNYYFPGEIIANGFTFRSYLEYARELMKETGVGNHPVWITETGFVSRPTNAGSRTDHGSPEKQEKWLAEAYNQAFDFGVERVFWLLLHDRTEPYFASMGLADSQNKPRPAWKAMQKFKSNDNVYDEKAKLPVRRRFR